MWSREKRKKAPTSRNDSLVLVVACIIEGEAKKRHQRAIKARWCSLWLVWSREKRKKAPTSRNNSLVPVVACIVEGEVKKAPMSHNDSLVPLVSCVVEGEVKKGTNESQGLVGACCSQRGRWRGGKSNQRVIRTCWCSL